MSVILNRLIERKIIEALGGEDVESQHPLPAQKKQIVVLHRGWIVIGDVSIHGDEIVVTDASVIRKWGTTRGLGEIASGGPTSSTVLDPCGTVRAHRLAVVMTIDCNLGTWKGKA